MFIFLCARHRYVGTMINTYNHIRVDARWTYIAKAEQLLYMCLVDTSEISYILNEWIVCLKLSDCDIAHTYMYKHVAVTSI